MSDKCMWCDQPSTRLCDATIGFAAVDCARNSAGKVQHLLAGLESERWTCDAPICNQHAKQVGWICGADVDTIDHCPHHAQAEDQGMERLVMFASEAERTRNDLYATIRRTKMRLAR